MSKKIHEQVKKCRESAIAAWAKGAGELAAGPWLAYINPVNICNSRCIMCPHSETMRKEKGRMSLGLFKRVVDELPLSIRKVYLIKQGDPFLNPQLEEMGEYLHATRPDIHISLHTNGIAAKPERVKRLLPVIDTLAFSCSAIERQAYEHVHGTPQFDKVLEHMKAANEAIGGLEEGKRPHFIVDYVRQQGNAAVSDADVVDFFAGHCPNLDSVDLHSLFNWQGDIPEGNLTGVKDIPEAEYPCCIIPWTSLVVCHDGKISYCFEEARENRFLGDITEQSFDEIWNGQEFHDFRTRFGKRDFKTLTEDGFACSKCSFLWDVATQSPRSLTGGHSELGKKSAALPPFGKWLSFPVEERFSFGCEAYLQGEIDRAMGMFSTFGSTGADTAYVEAAESMLKLCRDAVSQYANLEKWQQCLAKDDRQGSAYYPLDKSKGK